MEGQDSHIGIEFSEQEYTASLNLAVKQAERHEREIFRLKNSQLLNSHSSFIFFIVYFF